MWSIYSKCSVLGEPSPAWIRKKLVTEMDCAFAVCVTECDSGTDAELAEWLSNVGVDSDVADKVCLVQFVFDNCVCRVQ